MDLTEEHSPLILISAKVCLGQHSVLGSSDPLQWDDAETVKI